MAFKIGSCYCGCGTKGNKIKWAIAILGVLIGICFVIATFVSAANCYYDYDDCMKAAVTNGDITPAQFDEYHFGRQTSDQASSRTVGNTPYPAINACENDYGDCANASVGLFWGWILAWIIASIPLYMMCCCTRRPGHSNNHQFATAAPAHTTYQSHAPQTHTGYGNNTDGYTGGATYGGGNTYNGGGSYDTGAQGTHGGPPPGYPKPANV